MVLNEMIPAVAMALCIVAPLIMSRILNISFLASWGKYRGQKQLIEVLFSVVSLLVSVLSCRAVQFSVGSKMFIYTNTVLKISILLILCFLISAKLLYGKKS